MTVRSNRSPVSLFLVALGVPLGMVSAGEVPAGLYH